MNRFFLVLEALILSLGSVCSSSLQASQWDQKTYVTINAPVAVLGTVLPAGKYVFKLLDWGSDRNIVQVYNAEETHLITAFFAVPATRNEPATKSLFTLWETPAGQPRALRMWFYPGNSDGLEFPAQSAADSTNGSHASD